MKKRISMLLAALLLSTSVTSFAAEADDTPIEIMRISPAGSFVTFGSYEQDNKAKNGPEPIEWRVLENTGDSILLMSKYVLDGEPYSRACIDGVTWQPVPVTWETSSLRLWLNTTFMATAFTETEQARIMTVLNQNTPSDFDPNIKSYSVMPDGTEVPIALTNHGNDTYDRVFALSSDEVKKYFVFDGVRQTDYSTYEYSSALQIPATAYAKAHGVSVWTAKTTKTCLQMGGGYKYFAAECEGYVQSVVLRTLDNHGENKSALNIGADGAAGGTRTVTYDVGECPVIRLSLQQ